MIRRPPRSTRTDTLFPYTTLFRSIAPARPETGYGYIAAGDLLADRTGVRTVRRFVEKPGREKAAAMLAEGGHYWNAGIFLMRADRFLDELQRQQPAMAQDRAASMEARKRVVWGTGVAVRGAVGGGRRIKKKNKN